MGSKRQQTREELVEHLREQVSFLDRSASLYDEGHFGEAKRLAVTLRLLLHDRGKNSKALLSQLSIKHKLSFVDSAGVVEAGTKVSLGGGRFSETITVASLLAPIRLSTAGPIFVANLDDHGKDLPPQRFSEWWNNVVVSVPAQNRLSRGDIVRGVANQDGGAHIDSLLREGYGSFSRQQSLVGQDDAPIRIGLRDKDLMGPPNPALPMIRQIAWELCTTLKDQAKDLLES